MNAPFRRPGDSCLQAGPGAPIVPRGFRYLLLMRRDARGQALKPAAFHDLGDLARHIQRLRREPGGLAAALQLADSPILAAGEDTVRRGVSVWRLAPPLEDGRRRFLGWAWVDGASQVTLEAALRRAEQWERIA